LNVFQAVGITAGGWGFAARGVLRPPVREPMLVVTGLQLLLLIGIGFFHEPALAPVLEPVVRWIGGEAATHYPQHFWILPELLRTAGLAISLLVSPFAMAVATMRFAGGPGPWTDAFDRTPALLVLGLLGPGVAWTITSAFDRIPEDIALTSFVVRMGLQGAELVLLALLYSGLAYSVAYLMIGNRSLGHAIASSVRLSRNLAMPTFLLVALPLGLLFPLTFFLYEMDLSQAGIAPEAVGLLLALRIVLRIFLVALTVGGLTDLYLRSQGATE
jgi:hypothetical protein